MRTTHDRAWRDPAGVAAQWELPPETTSALLRSSVRGAWWETLEQAGICLLVSREYEHLLVGLAVVDGRPRTTYMRLPHPSGIAADRERERVFVASTRNPNQIFTFAPAEGALPRLDVAEDGATTERPLVPVASASYPGGLYLHDLALVGRRLHGNAVGLNAVVRFEATHRYEAVWWPRVVERDGVPDFRLNYLQLNSIAAGSTLRDSFFSASAARLSRRRPGHRNFPVDRRGVVFSGRTREPLVAGLTRPHSARLHEASLWVDDSGYGTVGTVEDRRYVPVARLAGWTRGLCFHGHLAFVGTSRVLPRFRQYAPGVDLDRSRCGVHAIDTRTGVLLGSITWPAGDQIFSLDWVPLATSRGLPFSTRPRPARIRRLFYTFRATEKETRA